MLLSFIIWWEIMRGFPTFPTHPPDSHMHIPSPYLPSHSLTFPSLPPVFATPPLLPAISTNPQRRLQRRHNPLPQLRLVPSLPPSNLANASRRNWLRTRCHEKTFTKCE